jgi:hypothetical protein
MKMVKSLLLGSAAGLVAIAGAQAADLPVKAKPVDYVRICSAYGAGFYYIPGTDICLRVGGYVFIEAGYNGRAGVPIIYSYNNPTLTDDRTVNRTNFRTRGDLILDARAQTAIGTVRTYISMGADWNNNLSGASGGTTTPYLERAFIQFAGFTAGQAATFFDFGAFYSIYGLASIAWDWRPVFAYTAQFGNGLSATISIEDGQAARSKIVAVGAPAWVAGANTFTTTSFYGGQQVPDIVANLRVDQAWGSAQLSGVLHQLRVNEAAAVAGVSDAWGWAVLGGIEIKTPMIAPGDSIMLQGVYSKGAVEYTGISSSPLGVALGVGYKTANGGLTGLAGPATDIWDSALGCPGSTSQCLSTAWSWNLMFRHFWQPNLRSAFWVGQNKYEPQGTVPFAPALTIWQAGGNVIWSPAPTLDLSLDLLWTRLSTEAGNCTGQIGLTCGVTADIWSAWTRWRRNF